MKLLPFLLLLSPIFAEVHERRVTVDKVHYVVSYNVRECNYTTFETCLTLTMPESAGGQTYYAATIIVAMRKDDQSSDWRVLIGDPFPGLWTAKGSFEDDPAMLVKYALKQLHDLIGKGVRLMPSDFNSNVVTGPMVRKDFPSSGTILTSDPNGNWAECYPDQLLLDPVVEDDHIVLNGKICKDGKFVSAQVYSRSIKPTFDIP